MGIVRLLRLFIRLFKSHPIWGVNFFEYVYWRMRIKLTHLFVLIKRKF